MTQIKSHIPKIRFKEFSGEWEEKKLGELSDKISDGLHSTPIYNDEGEYFFINGNNIVNGCIQINENTKKVDEDEYNKHKRILNGNTILMSINGTIGNLAFYNNEKIILGKSACYINLINEKSKIFVYNFLQTDKVLKFFYSDLTGSTIKNLGLTSIKNLKIPFPQLPEQQKIASFLSSVDEKIEKIKEKKKSLEEYKKGVMQKIFKQEIRFKDENGEEFGEWEEKKLKEICEKQSSNISANTLETNTGNYKIYGATGFLKYIDFYQEENDYISIVKDGAGVGRVLYCEGKSSVLGTLDKIKPKKGTNLNFLLSVLRNIDFTKYTIGSTIPHIYFKDYGKEKLLFPTLKEQEKIADFLSGIDEKIEKVSEELERVEEFKKGLLQGMFV